MSTYETLKNKQAQLIRKALEGSAFLGPITASAIGSLTGNNATPTSAVLSGSAAAVNIVTAGDLVLSVDGAASVTVALLAADAPASVVTKINAVTAATATASLVLGVLTITSASTGATASVSVVSGTGSVLADLKFVAGQVAFGANTGTSLLALPTGYDDLGWLSSDGVSFARQVNQSEVPSWGSVTPTRTDITSDSSTATVVCQETKLLTVGLATGADLAAVVAAAGTGEVSIAKPARPSAKSYRLLTLAVDQGDAGEIYIARFFPRAKVTNYAEQSFGGGDDPIAWGVTFTGEVDSTLGYSERWIFGGPGWQALLTDMNITSA